MPQEECRRDNRESDLHSSTIDRQQQQLLQKLKQHCRCYGQWMVVVGSALTKDVCTFDTFICAED